MGKRSNFKRRPQDAYDTPREAVWPLVPYLPRDFTYWEPCAGKGDLCRALYDLTDSGAYCAWDTDIEPRGVPAKLDALSDPSKHLCEWETCALIITNPPWTREILHPMIEHFSAMRPTWLLFDADWMHTKQAEPYLKWCRKIVSVGRVKWIPDSPYTGKDNCAWYLFDQNAEGPCEFVGRRNDA